MKKTSKSFIKFFGPALLALTALQPACLFGRPGPSAVGQGQEYRSGDPSFDQFFVELHELQVEMATAPKEEKETRIALAKKLGIELEEEAPPPAAMTGGNPPGGTPAPTPSPAPAVTPDPTVPGQPSLTDSLGQSAASSVPLLGQLNQVKNQVTAAKAQVDQMRTLANGVSSGVAQGTPTSSAAATPAAPAKPEIRPPSASLIARTVKEKAETLAVQLALAIDDDALEEHEVKTELRTAPEALEGDGRTLAEAVHDAARSELKLYIRMQKAKKDLDKLSALAGALDNMVDTTFKKGGISKKAEVRKNLEDARTLIKLMQERAKDVSGKAKEVVDKLEESASAKLDLEPAAAPVDSATASESPAAAPAPAAPPVDAAPKKAKRSGASKPRPMPQPADFEP